MVPQQAPGKPPGGCKQVKPGEIRHIAIQTLLQTETPQTVAELADVCGLSQKQLRGALESLVKEGLAVSGRLVRGDEAMRYRWAARSQEEIGKRAGSAKEEAEAAVEEAGRVPDNRLWLDSPPVIAFNRYIADRYEPPHEKRFLVFFQCSVRRPFSKSPSHGSMRRAISVATGCDPAKDFEQCPVHVVVLASKVGPVPYELEDVYPANVRAGGVKHFDENTYQAALPVLAERMADYMRIHGDHYDAMWTFTESRYGDVMTEAARQAKAKLGVLPDSGGARVLRLGESVPRTYWQKFWIQLYLEIVAQLDPDERNKARGRLEKLRVEYE